MKRKQPIHNEKRLQERKKTATQILMLRLQKQTPSSLAFDLSRGLTSFQLSHVNQNYTFKCDSCGLYTHPQQQKHKTSFYYRTWEKHTWFYKKPQEGSGRTSEASGSVNGMLLIFVKKKLHFPFAFCSGSSLQKLNNNNRPTTWEWVAWISFWLSKRRSAFPQTHPPFPGSSLRWTSTELCKRS